MKKYVRWMLMCAVVCGIGMSVTSCKDDDDDGRSEISKQADPYDKTSEEGMALFGLVCQVAGVDSLPNDWKTAQFEPTVGKALDASQPYVRTLAVEDADEAERYFSSIAAGAENGKWSVKDVGTMTFSRLNSDDCTATIDVQVKQLPHLTQIRLVPASALGENASDFTEDEVYYSLGDVVYRSKDKTYWICVRPCNQEAGKGDNHWICVWEHDVPSANLKTSYANHVVLTGMAYSVEHMNNFAQMLRGILVPRECSQWYDGLPKATGLVGLKKQYNNMTSLERVQALWTAKNIWGTVFHSNIEAMQAMKELHTIYYGYSCWGFDMTIYWHRNSGLMWATGNESASKDKVEWPLSGNKFNVQNYTNGTQKGQNTQGPDMGWVVSYATGEQLCNSKSDYSPKKALTGCTTIVRYKDNAPSAIPTLGAMIGNDGQFYKTFAGCKSYTGSDPVAMVAYLG